MATRAQIQASTVRRTENRARGRARAYPRVRARPCQRGSSYKVTKRCLERRMFLAPGVRPHELVNFLGYCLAYAANKHGIQIHAVVMMSNHHHTDLTDPHGELPAFKQLFHSMVARGLNARRGRFDKFWSGDAACDTQRPSDDETFQDLVYTITNPVESGLVRRSDLWPGLTSAGWRFGETRSFRRPKWFFDEGGEMPETVSLTLARPPIFAELDDDELYEKLAAAVWEHERGVQAKMRRQGRKFMGPTRIKKQGWNKAAQSVDERFEVKPKVAASSKWQRLAQLQRNREWEREYAAARALLWAGEPAVFPVGTYYLRRFAGVTVAPHSPS